MISRSSSQGPDSDGGTVPGKREDDKRRTITVYDVTAGRITKQQTLSASRNPTDASTAGPAQPEADLDDDEDKMYSQNNQILTPEEVLFRRHGAPERMAEHDIYFANEHDLPDGGRDALPDSDLLKAVHAYTSRFYEARARRSDGNDYVGERLVDERSMDETALLAFGILLEEAAREVVGKRGDLVFTEGRVAENGPSSSGGPTSFVQGGGQEGGRPAGEEYVGFEDTVRARRKRSSKKQQPRQPAAAVQTEGDTPAFQDESGLL